MSIQKTEDGLRRAETRKIIYAGSACLLLALLSFLFVKYSGCTAIIPAAVCLCFNAAWIGLGIIMIPTMKS